MRILPRTTLKTFLALLLLIALGAGGYAAWYVASPLGIKAYGLEALASLRIVQRPSCRRMSTTWKM